MKIKLRERTGHRSVNRVQRKNEGREQARERERERENRRVRESQGKYGSASDGVRDMCEGAYRSNSWVE